MSVLQVDHAGLLDLFVRAYLCGVSLFAQGATGIGKSYTAVDAGEVLADKLHLEGVALWPEVDVGKFNLVDLRLSQFDAVDMRGFPMVKDGAVTWYAPDFFSLPPEAKGYYWFDELNLAPPLIQASAYSVIWDRRSGNKALPTGMGVAAGGNRIEDKASIFDLARPLANRFIWCELQVPTEEAWCNWAMNRGLDARIVGFVKQNPNYLHYTLINLGRTDGDTALASANGEKAFPTPRSWELASKLITGVRDLAVVQNLVSAAVGPATAALFIGFAKLVAEIDIDAILANPEKSALPDKIDRLYALITALAERFRSKPDKDVLKKVMTLSGRIAPEFGVLLLRMVKAQAFNAGGTIKSAFSALLRECGLVDKFKKYLI